MHTMHRDRPVEAPVNRTALHIRAVHVSLHVEVNRVTAETERLSCVRDFNVAEMSRCQALTLLVRVYHYLYAELIATPLFTKPVK